MFQFEHQIMVFVPNSPNIIFSAFVNAIALFVMTITVWQVAFYAHHALYIYSLLVSLGRCYHALAFSTPAAWGINSCTIGPLIYISL